jgi:transcriptional regulator with XRE-family HTH domain
LVDGKPRSLGERLKAARAAAGFTQADAALKISCGQSTLGEWERNIAPPPANQLATMAELYGCSSDYLLGLPVRVPAGLVLFDADLCDLLKDTELPEVLEEKMNDKPQLFQLMFRQDEESGALEFRDLKEAKAEHRLLVERVASYAKGALEDWRKRHLRRESVEN